MIEKIRARQNDKAAGELVTFLFVVPLLLSLFFGLIDGGFYLNNRTQINNAARDAARTVSILGGNGTYNKGTTIEAQYALSRSSSCSGITSNPAYRADMSAVECNLLKSLDTGVNLVNVKVTSVRCNPQVALNVGQTVSCEVQWRYPGVGAGLSLFRWGEALMRDPEGDGKGLSALQKSKATAQSEVKFSGPSDLVSRS